MSIDFQDQITEIERRYIRPTGRTFGVERASYFWIRLRESHSRNPRKYLARSEIRRGGLLESRFECLKSHRESCSLCDVCCMYNFHFHNGN